MSLVRGFWADLPKGFVGLAPMDGVTDSLYRLIQAKYAKPHLMMTEFTAVEGVARNAVKLLRDFQYHETERPICAQVFGTDPECFYTTAVIVAELGFDGVDINMGCPAKNVSGRGAGAGLIRNPDLARQIIEATQAGVRDYADGVIGLEELSLKQKMKTAIQAQKENRPPVPRRHLPVSVKTRIGYDSEVIEWWVSHLLESQPVTISIHGRTLKQMYSGEADWEAIAKAAKIIAQTDTLCVGNGDIQSLSDAQQKIEQYGVDGVLIGRATFGNPWIFSDHQASYREKARLALHHSKLYETFFPEAPFFPMRKHLAWYIKGHPHAAKIRSRLMLADSSRDVVDILEVSE